ncbi:hypothetical protein EV363DRAFT_1269920 [Boletus edulis]|nr:hypothetical protein EV363DRAFT_1269920 [Boletus edulis]
MHTLHVADESIALSFGVHYERPASVVVIGYELEFDWYLNALAFVPRRRRNFFPLPSSVLLMSCSHECLLSQLVTTDNNLPLGLGQCLEALRFVLRSLVSHLCLSSTHLLRHQPLKRLAESPSSRGNPTGDSLDQQWEFKMDKDQPHWKRYDTDEHE